MSRSKGFYTAYPLQDQPLGTTVPYMPQAEARKDYNAFPGLSVAPSSRIKEFPTSAPAPSVSGASTIVDESESNHPAGQKPVTALHTLRPMGSVTDIPGAIEGNKRVHKPPDYKNAGKPLKPLRLGAIAKENMAKPVPEASEMARQSKLWLIAGFFCPIFLLCGLRFIRSPNQIAKIYGMVALLLLMTEITLALVLGTQYLRTNKWQGGDPSCLQFSYGAGNKQFINNPIGSAAAVQGMSPGQTIMANVTLYTVNCFFAGEMLVPAGSNSQPKTVVARAITPGTFGDDFGLYLRPLDSQLNPTASGAVTPSLSWLQYSSPYISNPGGQGRPQCIPDMCDGVYGQAPIGGSMYDARAEAGWYQYYYMIGVVALKKGALERPFCIDTCVLNWIETPVGSGNFVEPCVGVALENCAQASGCTLVSTRQQCLGIRA